MTNVGMTNDDTEDRDVIVVGSGPAGYTAAIYLARANLRPLVVEGAVSAGGALMNTTEVENFPGFPDGLMGPALMDGMRAQAERFGAELLVDDAIAVELGGDVKTVRTPDRSFRAATIVLAMGSAYRRLLVPGENELSGHGVSWCATCDGFFFRDKDVAVVGGGDSAVEEATFLTRFARSVTLIHRRDRLRASQIMQDRAAANPKIRFVWNSEVVEMIGSGEKVDSLTALRLRSLVTGVEEHLPVSGAFVAIGHNPRSELVVGQVKLDPSGYVVTEPDSTRTDQAGVFAAGDLVDHTFRQAITAAGTGCMAALEAERYLAGLPDESVVASPARTFV